MPLRTLVGCCVLRRQVALLPLALLPLALLLTPACQSRPETTCLALDTALHRRDLDAVHHLVSKASQAAIDVLWRAGESEKSPFHLASTAPKLEVRSMRSQGLRQVVTVAQGKTEREWVLVEEDGEWRVDLFETALRRPWNSPTSGN